MKDFLPRNNPPVHLADFRPKDLLRQQSKDLLQINLPDHARRRTQPTSVNAPGRFRRLPLEKRLIYRRDLGEEAVEDGMTLIPKLRTGWAAAALASDEADHAGQLPENVNFPPPSKEAVERVKEAVKGGSSKVFKIRGRDAVQVREIEAGIKRGKPLQESRGKAPIPLIALGAI